MTAKIDCNSMWIQGTYIYFSKYRKKEKDRILGSYGTVVVKIKNIAAKID